MRTVYFLVPRVESRIGGYLAEAATVEVARTVCDAQIVTYGERDPNLPFVDDVLPRASPGNAIFIISWGHDVPKLLRLLEGQNVVYHAHSAGYPWSLPPEIPIISVSRYTMGYWGRKSPNALHFLLPNVLRYGEASQTERDIDVLVQVRKSSRYVLRELVPLLEPHVRVEVLKAWVDDLPSYFGRSKVFLYDSSEYWIMAGITEGFGLPPLEAMCCGCVVFANVNDALSDFLDPGFNCHELRVYSAEYDKVRILEALRDWKGPPHVDDILKPFLRKPVSGRMAVIMKELNRFFDLRGGMQADIIVPRRPWRMPPLLTFLPEAIKRPLRKGRDRIRRITSPR